MKNRIKCLLVYCVIPLWAVSNNGYDIYNTNIINVGIGTTTPQHLLQVAGDAQVGNLYVDATTWNTGNTFIGQNLAVGASATISGILQIGNVPQRNIFNASTNPTGYSLYVQGGILSEQYKCALSNDATNWSDYVFDKDYKLAPLADVEAYIKSNKHLPGVPSTDDVHCDGIDVAKMDGRLLQKIEELTLYVIQLKGELDELKTAKK